MSDPSSGCPERPTDISRARTPGGISSIPLHIGEEELIALIATGDKEGGQILAIFTPRFLKLHQCHGSSSRTKAAV